MTREIRKIREYHKLTLDDVEVQYITDITIYPAGAVFIKSFNVGSAKEITKKIVETKKENAAQKRQQTLEEAKAKEGDTINL